MPKILIADDEPLIRLLIREILSIDPTLSFLEATNGVAALEVARNMRPDLIILDIMMPKMDGLQVCLILKSDPLLQIIPVILITAAADSKHNVAGQEAGAEGFLHKPLDEAALFSTVADALQNHTG